MPVDDSWNKAAVLSALGALLGGAILIAGTEYLASREILLISMLQFALLLHPIREAIREYRVHADLMQPRLVGIVTFICFHILWNVVPLANPEILRFRGVDVDDVPSLLQVVWLSYALVFVAWWSFYAGLYIFGSRPASTESAHGESPGTLRLFVLAGLLYIVIGVAGNVLVLGGVGAFMGKMLRFFERWDVWDEAPHGHFLSVLIRFLPVGLVLLVLALSIRRTLRPRRLLWLLLAASVANLVLSNATGGRGTGLLVFMYAIPLVNAFVSRLSIRVALLVAAFAILASFLLGVMRDAASFGVSVSAQVVDLSDAILALSYFAAMYLTNFASTLILVNIVSLTGVAWGSTAFAGITGLFGGPTPLTTEQDVWNRLGLDLVYNPRYGPPGELYFNFGWLGVVLGMLLIGIAVTLFDRMYARGLQRRSVSGGMAIVFASFSANFVVIGNLSYMPSYFTWFAAPFYAVFALDWVLRRVAFSSSQQSGSRRDVPPYDPAVPLTGDAGNATS